MDAILATVGVELCVENRRKGAGTEAATDRERERGETGELEMGQPNSARQYSRHMQEPGRRILMSGPGAWA